MSHGCLPDGAPQGAAAVAWAASGDSPGESERRSTARSGGAQEQWEMEAERGMGLQHRSKVHLGDKSGDKATCSVGPRSTHAQEG